MGFKCGIVGLPNVGKSTLFNALTASKNAEAANFPFCTIDPNIGIVDVVEHLDPEKKKRFIKLICKVKGIGTYSGQKTIHDDITVTAEDCELVIKEVLGIDLTVENIHV